MRTATAVLLVALLSACPAMPVTDGGAGGGSGGAGGGGGGVDGGVDAGTPRRILVMFDGTSSLSVTDPNAMRLEALRALLTAHAGDPSMSVGVMAFSGTSTAWFSSATPDFVPMTSLGTSERNTLVARLAAYSSSPDAGDFSDFVRALGDAYVAISADVSRQQGADYAVIFLSDGRPTNNQDDQLLCGDSVKRIRELRLSGAGDVRLHTVHVFMPLAAPTCSGDAGWMAGSACAVPVVGNPGECPAAEVDADATRLRQMSVVGGGEFRDFRGQGAVTFTGLVP
jgi:hypothetical protein